jgi:hypothetical protein
MADGAFLLRLGGVRTFRRFQVRLLFLAALLTIASTHAMAQDSASDFDQFAPKLSIDFGQIVKGKTGSSEFEYQPMNRNTLVLSQTGHLGQAWTFKMGIMGLLWWPFNTNPTEPIHRTVRSEVRLQEAVARLDFRMPAQAPTYLELGWFQYKYNPDAHNLGEYLYRSGTYPGIVYTTDGYQLMDDAFYESLGAHFRGSQLNGLITHDVNLFVEPYMAPIGDVTPGYEIGLHLPIFQAGIGGAWNRLFAWRPSRLRPKTPDNTYAKVTDVRVNAAGAPDTVVIAGRLDQIAPFNPVDTVVLGHWTKQGLKLMARAALDLGFLLPRRRKGPEDLRIFAEAAVLGWENQGFFYEKRSQRIPVMAGINIPTFKLLDLLSVQAEYYAARFDNIQSNTTSSFPVWDVDSFSDYDPSRYEKDDWKWSVYAVRSLGKLARVRVQVANDHLRLREFLLQQSDETLTRRPSHGYYLLRLEFGL